MDLDPDAIGQAVHNLLDNAVKYSGDSKDIAVRLAQDGRWLVIAVQDHGIGIARDEQKKIFERFHRVGTGLVHDVKGSGLGLSIVHHIVQAHGGDVCVESEPGRGSTFTSSCPSPVRRGKTRRTGIRRARGRSPRGCSARPESARRDGTQMPKVLIVEDDEAMSTALARRLRVRRVRGGRWRADGAAGLQLAGQASPDVIILDVMLPKMSGLDVCKQLREEGNPVPIIMLTARGQEIDKVLGLEARGRRLRHQAVRLHGADGARRGGPAARARGSASARSRTASATWTSTSRRGRRARRASSLDLSPRELRLLEYFIEHRGEVVDRDELLDAVWDYDTAPLTRTVDMHVAKLRKKIEDDRAPTRSSSSPSIAWATSSPAERLRSACRRLLQRR